MMMRSHNKRLERDQSVVQPHNKGRLRDWVKLGLATTLERSGLFATYRTLRTYTTGPRIHVIGYHRVVDAVAWDGPVNPSLCISTEALRRQMQQLRERFVVLPLSYVVRALTGEIAIPHDAVCVTFDDGYRDVIVRAHNILRELEIPATVFVPTGFAGASGPERFLPHDRLYAALSTARRQGLALAELAADITRPGRDESPAGAPVTPFPRVINAAIPFVSDGEVPAASRDGSDVPQLHSGDGSIAPQLHPGNGSDLPQLHPGDDSDVLRLRPSGDSDVPPVRPSESSDKPTSPSDGNAPSLRPGDGSAAPPLRPGDGSAAPPLRSSDGNRSAPVASQDVATAELLARVDSTLFREGPAAAAEAMIRDASAATLARAIAALEARLGPPRLDPGAAVLTPDEVRTLAESGWEIGAHTIDHVVLTHEPLPEVRRQLLASKHDLERWSGRPCRFFAYCNGFHNPALVEELRRAGYEGAVTTWDRPNIAGLSDPFRISRKVLWEAHARGPHGRFSPSLSAAHLHDLFGLLGLTAPLDGFMEQAHNKIVQLHNNERTTPDDGAQTHDDPEPTEVELAY
jgi:peptidoglycan/xylan/chitin deacetylase (PgdA/CDA1 family)